LDEIYEDKAAAERALNARRIIEFPHGDSGEPQSSARDTLRNIQHNASAIPGAANLCR